MSTPAGWYPDPHVEGQQRYWDGSAWTQHHAPLAQQQTTDPAAWSAPTQPVDHAQRAAAPTGAKKPFWRRTWVLVTAGSVVVLGVIGAASGNSAPKDPAAAHGDQTVAADQDKTAAPAPTATPRPAVTQAADPAPAPTKTPKPKPTPKPAPAHTVSQDQAIGSARDYLALQGFSRTGLIKQLSSDYGDGFSQADAIFAVNHLGADWNAQAVRSAKEYLSFQHFSRAGLIQQLSSSYGDGYTLAQATYAANHVGL
jgi:hypothetical protein